MNALALTFVGIVVLVTLPVAYALIPRRSVPARQLAGNDSRFVTVKGREIHYTRHGQGSPIVLIHGFAGSTYTWRELIPLLARDYTVYAVDLLGFGLSDKPGDGDYSLSDQGNLILDLIAALKLQRPALVGHSMGGVVAALAAVQSPYTASRLVLIDAGFYHGGPPEFVKYLFFPFDVAAARWFYTKGVRTMSLRRSYNDQSLITEALVYNYLKPAGTPGAAAAVARMNKYGFVRYEDLCVRIRTPTLLVWGRDDRIVPLTDAERIRQEIAGSLLAVVDDAGHMAHEERPRQVAAAIRAFAQ
jgi:pimeloyl-ACP methyl ester carboxylesterase